MFDTTTKALLAIAVALPALGADAAPTANADLWELAAEAYQAGQIETGHIHLKSLITQRPGDIDLAIRCLEEILERSKREDATRLAEQPHLIFIDNPSGEFAARQLCALEREGIISAHRQSVRDAFTVLVEHHFQRGRLFEASELIDRFVTGNPHDAFWRIQKARFLLRLDSARARPLVDALRDEMALDHPDPAVRGQWSAFAEELQKHGDELPQELFPIRKGSPLPDLEPDDPDGDWARIAGRSIGDVCESIDRLISGAFMLDKTVPWRSKRGHIDPKRALDLHLLTHSSEQLQPMRELQDIRIGLEFIEDNPSDARILSLCRRYPWSLKAQQMLRELGNRMLFAGRAQAARRCFADLLDHTADDALRDQALVGLWTARVHSNEVSDVADLLGDVSPDRPLSWFGKPTPAREICTQLIEARGPRASERSNPDTLEALSLKVVRLPPTPAWESDLPNELDLTTVDGKLLVSGRDMLVMYDARNPDAPLWKTHQPFDAGENKRGANHPGYFRPHIENGTIHTRWGFSSQPPRGIAGIDAETGTLQWTDSPSTPRSPLARVPLGDPLVSDGLSFCLQWQAQGDISKGHGRKLELACFDTNLRKPIWAHTIAEGRHSSDVTTSLERAVPASSIYGNRVTIHEGAVYSNSNCGIVARSDVRDGQTEWIHHYRVVPLEQRNVLNHGSEPIIAGDKVICMPKDARTVFALDQLTGRLVWENNLALGIQLLGASDEVIVVRGNGHIAGLDLETGEARWHHLMEGRTIGRAQLVGPWACVANHDGLHRIDIRTGRVAETRAWQFENEAPRGFLVDGETLFAVTDKPGDQPGWQTDQPLTVDATKPDGLLAKAWSLPRDNAKIAMPPTGSALRGSAFVFSSGILERIDLTEQGGIRWQRFVDGHNPSIELIDDALLVVDYSNGRAPGLGNRVTAVDANTGGTLWEQTIDAPVKAALHCGKTRVFHDAVSRLVAVDVETGRRIWERNLGNGFQMRLSWDGQHLHVFYVSHLRAAHHLIVDARSGRTTRDNSIVAKTSASARNAKAIKGGYYEVMFDPVRARHVRLVALSEVKGMGWASIAELQVAGEGGSNLPRDKWTATASMSETKANYDTSPRCIIDNDPVTWWHSPWKDSIPPHPHEVRIDMGVEQTVTGFRYLPADIINDNGMIREYEFYVSRDGKEWGAATASGFLVNRALVDHAYASDQSIVFASRGSKNQPLNIFRYPLDGSEAILIQRNAHVHYMQEPYYITTVEKHLVVRRFDDPAYEFRIGETEKLDTQYVEIENDRLVLGRKGIVVADLKSRRFVVAPASDDKPYNMDGVVLREGAHGLLKFVPNGADGQRVYQFDLRTGAHTVAHLSEQLDSFQPAYQRQDRSIDRFDGIVLLSDNSSVSAWIASTP